MKSRILLLFLLFLQSVVYSQYKISGRVVTADNKPINKVQIYNETGGLLAQTGVLGKFKFSTEKEALQLIIYVEAYQLKNVYLQLKDFVNLKVTLETFSQNLSEIQIKARTAKVFELKRLGDVEGTSIFAGKKTEVVLVNQSAANLAANNARQIFNQIAGLNIFQNDDAGLQLNIGGRGLNPNRTANFNTRQNGYDISADVLGYPESYYTPASEGLDEIQIVRGAASLQYGTQFGGLINFITKKPSTKPLEIITRNTVGSFGLFTNFTSFSGTSGKFSYYSYINYKKGNGFRPNSNFDSK
ncbi:MAG: Fe(3+) dicitrate transport protein, partial [Arenicella sp.]